MNNCTSVLSPTAKLGQGFPPVLGRNSLGNCSSRMNQLGKSQLSISFNPPIPSKSYLPIFFQKPKNRSMQVEITLLGYIIFRGADFRWIREGKSPKKQKNHMVIRWCMLGPDGAMFTGQLWVYHGYTMGIPWHPIYLKHLLKMNRR
jgi:hypothetical protein